MTAERIKAYPLLVDELDVDGMGCVFYSKGRHDPAAFVAEIERIYSCEYAPALVRHGWYFWGVSADEQYTQVLMRGKEGQRGCFPATVLEDY